MLNSTINSASMEEKVKAAANKHFGHRKANTVFEHGHWWVMWYDESEDCNRTYDVVDAEGPGTTNGFDFEEV
jgi:hypothetical protein